MRASSRRLAAGMHPVGDMDPVRELPYGTAASGAASEAGQMAATDHVQSFKKPLAPYGRPQMGRGQFAFGHRTKKADITVFSPASAARQSCCRLYHTNAKVLGRVNGLSVGQHFSIGLPKGQSATSSTLDADLIAHQLCRRRDIATKADLADADGSTFPRRSRPA